MALLQVEPGLVIWTWITFLLVFLVLGLGTWKRILGGFKARADKIQSDIEEADKAKEEAKKSVVSQREQMEEVKREASSIIESARTEALSVKEKIIYEANEQIATNKVKVLSEIERAQKEALEDIRKEASSLACSMAEAILKRSFSEKDHEDLIKDFIAKAGEKHSGR